MTVFLTLLRVLGIILAVLLVLVLLLILVVLFVPLRYSFEGEIRDPEGDSRIFHLDPAKDITASGSASWLFGAVRARASVGKEGGPEGLVLEARVFGFPLPLDKILSGKKGGEKKKEERPPAPREDKTIDERIDEVLDRIERIWRRLEDAFYVLDTEYAHRARQVLTAKLLRLLEAVLPAEWAVTGVLGLGDPARSAGIFAVQGFLYPLIAGHVSIGTEYELYRYDLRSAARGKVRIWSFVRTGVGLVLSRDVRRLLARLRRGPSSSGGGRKKRAGHRHAAA